jgi:carboxyl-terminal processing protease
MNRTSSRPALPWIISCLLVLIMLCILTCACSGIVLFVNRDKINTLSTDVQQQLNNIQTQIPQLSGTPEPTNPADPAQAPVVGNTDPKAGMPVNMNKLFGPFWEIWDLLHENFVDQPMDDQALMFGALQNLQTVAFALPAATSLPETMPQMPTPTPVVPVPTRVPGANLFDPFWSAWVDVHDRGTTVDDVDLIRAAIDGMLAATGDKHTSYMNPILWKQANNDMAGEYTGIGAWVDTTGEYIQVISPMKNSPAEAAGIRAKDIVIGVNGKDVTGIPGDIVLQDILGPAGEAVTLTIKRGEEILNFTIIRAKITVPVVEYEMKPNNIGYIALRTFNENSTTQLRDALDDLRSQGMTGLVFDLRDNGGGLLNVAIEVTSEFIPDGVIMYEEYGDGRTITFDTKKGGRATEIPMIVLINGGSASASEIAAGAIQDRGRARLLGVTSYGKGSVQNWIPLTTEESGVRITIARWLTPNRSQISEVGLTPDILVERTDADYEADRDPQLDAALQLLGNP